MSKTDTPLSKAIETAVALVEWAENSSDTPASFRTCFSQRAIVADVTGWCGLISERKVLSFPCFAANQLYGSGTAVVSAQGIVLSPVRDYRKK